MLSEWAQLETREGLGRDEEEKFQDGGTVSTFEASTFLT